MKIEIYYHKFLNRRSRNPLSIQVCFNWCKKIHQQDRRCLGRNPLSIQVCFNGENIGEGRGRLRRVVIPYQFRSVSMFLGEAWNMSYSTRRNPLLIQVCFNEQNRRIEEKLSRS